MPSRSHKLLSDVGPPQGADGAHQVLFYRDLGLRQQNSTGHSTSQGPNRLPTGGNFRLTNGPDYC